MLLSKVNKDIMLKKPSLHLLSALGVEISSPRKPQGRALYHLAEVTVNSMEQKSYDFCPRRLPLYCFCIIKQNFKLLCIPNRSTSLNVAVSCCLEVVKYLNFYLILFLKAFPYNTTSTVQKITKNIHKIGFCHLLSEKQFQYQTHSASEFTTGDNMKNLQNLMLILKFSKSFSYEKKKK